MSKGFARLAVAAVAMTVVATGCGNGSDDAGAGGEGAGTVGISMPTKSIERWISDGDNMVKQFEAAGFDTDLEYADDVPQNQVSQIDAMIEAGVDVLVVAAIDSTSLTSVLHRAKAAHIPVISYDRLIRDTPDVDYYATFDNFKVGVLQATYVVEALGLKSGKGPFNVELFAGDPDDNNATFFYNGAMSVLKPYLASKKLVVRSGETSFHDVATARWDGARAQDRMEKVLSAEYTDADVAAVLSPNDGIARGILQALKSHGYGKSGKRLAVVTGQDAEVASVKSIIAGEQAETVYKDTRELAKVTVRMATTVLKGGKPQVNDVKTYNNGVKVVPTYLLEPVGVDRSNYEEVLLKSGYYTPQQLKE